jgi:hypothetical protein
MNEHHSLAQFVNNQSCSVCFWNSIKSHLSKWPFGRTANLGYTHTTDAKHDDFTQKIYRIERRGERRKKLINDEEF